MNNCILNFRSANVVLIDYCMKDSSYVYCRETVNHGGNYTKGPSFQESV